ncbi:hypothetical protein [Nonomuraea sp. 10N515B]
MARRRAIVLKAERSDSWGNQADSMVLAKHRGHRLSLLLDEWNEWRLAL